MVEILGKDWETRGGVWKNKKPREGCLARAAPGVQQVVFTCWRR